MIVNYVLEGAAIALSPLSAYLVFRYLKNHVVVLHEDMRKLITDSATITRRTVYSVTEDLSKISQKDHGDTRVFMQNKHDEAVALASKLHTEAAVLADTEYNRVETLAKELHTEALGVLSAAKEDIKAVVSEASTVAQRSSIEVASGIQSSIRQSNRDATALQELVNARHAEAKAVAEALHETLIEGVSTAQSALKSAIDSSHESLKKDVQGHVENIRSDFAKAVSTVEAKTVQATRERLDRPTEVVVCTKCGCNVVRHENNICFTCLKRG